MNAAQLKAEYATKAAAMHRLQMVDRVQNEGGEGFSLYESASAALYAEYAPLIAATEAAEFAADWTLPVLTERRADWNCEIAKMIAEKQPMTAKSMAAIVAKVGFSQADLIRAKALHNVK